MRFFLIAAAVVSLVAAAPTAADNPQLVGSVGPGFAISLSSGGTAVKHLDPGTYTLVVHDLAEEHNFHLTGPGVNVTTEIEFMGDKTFTITLADGLYDFICDAHAGTMHGEFAVGSAQLPVDNPPPKPTTPPTRKLSLRVGAGGRVTAPAHVVPGKYAVTVTDASGTENVHLRGAGVDRKTTAAFKGTAHWTVTLKRGSYRALSDTHPKLARTISVS
jgi:plastocyanin